MTNILQTDFVVNERSGLAKVDLIDKRLDETDKKFGTLGGNVNFGDKMAKEFSKAENIGLNSLNRLKNAANEIEKTFSGPQLAFADKYKSAFSDIETRSRKLGESFQKLSQTKLERGQFDVIAQGAIGAEAKVVALTRKIRDLKRDAADPANAQFGKYYAQGLKEAENELARFERKLTSLNRQQIASGGGAGGIGAGGGGFANQFSNRFFGGYAGLSSGAILGGLAGGAALAGIQTTTNALAALGETFVDLTVKSVKAAGNFEESTNALSIFAGGVNNARRELKALDEIALNTPGLRIETAEAGYKRLRALNFEAKTSQDLIRGLGIARAQSGADQGAVDRVITNLTQLTSGAGTAADVRQTIGAIPSLRRTFKDAFGTTDFGELNKLAKSRPDEFIRKFSEELNKAQTAQVGLNLSIERASDTILQAGRDFGEPFLQPLTRDVLALTKGLNDNRGVLKEWGQDLADFYNGLSGAVTASGATPGDFINTRSLPGINALGLGEAASFVYENVRRLGEERRKAEARANPSAEGFVGFDFGAEAQVNEDKEKQLKERQKLIEFQKKLDDSEIENNLNYSKAVAASRYGGAALIRETAKLEIDALRRQIESNNRFAASATQNLSSEDFTKGEGLQISRKNAEDNAKLQSQISVLQITSQRQIAEEIKNTEKQIKQLNKSYNEVFSNLAQKSQSSNPFAQVFAESRSEAEKLRESIKGLPPELQQAAIKMQGTIDSNRLFSARLDNKFATLDLEDTAERFRRLAKPTQELFDSTFKNFVEKKADEIKTVFNQIRDENGKLLGISQSSNNPFVRFNRVQGGGFTQTDVRENALTAFDVLANGSTIRRERKFGDLSESEKRALIDQFRLQSDDQLSLNQRLQKRLDEANLRFGTPEQQSLADARALSFASSLNPSDIDFSKREQLAQIAEREAARRREYENLAIRLYQSIDAHSARIAAATEGFSKIAREKGTSGLSESLEIKVVGDVVSSVMGANGTEEDIRNTYFSDAN